MAINLLMLITWNAKASLEDYQKAKAPPAGSNTTDAPIPWELISE